MTNRRPPEPPQQPIREDIVNELNRAVANDDERAVAETWGAASDAEKAAVAARQGSTADTLEKRAQELALDLAAQNLARNYWRAHALMEATHALLPYWHGSQAEFTVSRGLKVAPRRIAYDAVRWLRLAGFTEGDGLPDLGDPPGPND